MLDEDATSDNVNKKKIGNVIFTKIDKDNTKFLKAIAKYYSKDL